VISQRLVSDQFLFSTRLMNARTNAFQLYVVVWVWTWGGRRVCGNECAVSLLKEDARHLLDTLWIDEHSVTLPHKGVDVMQVCCSAMLREPWT
jgi:hypothetical protein